MREMAAWPLGTCSSGVNAKPPLAAGQTLTSTTCQPWHHELISLAASLLNCRKEKASTSRLFSPPTPGLKVASRASKPALQTLPSVEAVPKPGTAVRAEVSKSTGKHCV